MFDICHDRNTVRGEEKRQVEGREGKRENGGVVIDARKKKKLRFGAILVFGGFFLCVCVCVHNKQDKKTGVLSLSHTAVSSGLRTK